MVTFFKEGPLKYNVINKCLVNNPAQNRIPSNQSNSDDEIYDDLYEIDDNAEGFKSDIESRKTKTYKVPRQKVLNSDNDDISDPEISSPFMMSFMKKREMSKQLIEFRSPKSSINPKEVFGKEIEEGKEKEEGNAAYYRNERNKDIFLSLLNNNPREIFENESSLQEFEDLRKNKQFYPPLIENLLHKVNFKDLTKEIGYRLVKSTPNMRILQNDHEPLSFKAFVTLNFDIWAILDCFLDPSQYRNWNNTVTEHKIIQNIEGLNSVIIEEKRNYQSSFYKTREFYYSRTIIPLRNMRQFILIDKSINKPNDSNAASSFWYTKGIINHNFIAILPHPKNPQSHLLILCCDIDNQGYFLTHHQNSELTLAYLSQFANLETFLSQRLFFGNHSKQEILTKYPFLNPQNENISKHLHESPKNPFLPPQKLHDFEDSIPKNEQTSQTNNLLESIVERVELDQKIQRFSSLNEDIFEEVKTSVLKPIEETQIIPKNKEKKPLGLQNTNHLLQMLKSNEHINQILKYDFVLRPRKITEEEIQLQPIDPVNGHYALSKDWSRAKEGGLLWYNKKELEVQGKVLSYLIKRMGSNLIQGKSVINISLPVDLFDIKSFLERIAYSYTYAPYFLEPSPKNLDPSSPEFERPGLYQIYQVVCFILSSMHLSINQKKPFNPILGETFQGWIKGCPIYCEQISHHPPISSFLMLGNGYKIQGNFEITASMHPNSVTGKQLGLGQVIFDLGNEKSKKIYFTFPPCVVSGLAFGSRIVNYEGKVYIFDAGEKLAMELNFNPDKKGMFSGMLSKQKTANDYFKGVVYELKEAAIDKMIKGLLAKKYSGLNFKEDLASPTEISVCEGVWHDYLEIKGKKFWELKDFQAFQLEYEDHPLPSDCLYREDLIVWRGADLEEAQKMKEKLENIQRADRKLREKIRGKKH